VLRKLREGECVKVAGVSRVKEPWIAELIGRLGYDVIWFDMEHRAFSYDVIDPMSLACRATGIDLMVRALKEGYMSPMRALEFGANGIMVPHCRSVEEARQWVEWSRFPPLGKRGIDAARADADYMLADPLDHLRHGNEETFLVLQIEDREAVECVDDIPLSKESTCCSWAAAICPPAAGCRFSSIIRTYSAPSTKLPMPARKPASTGVCRPAVRAPPRT